MFSIGESVDSEKEEEVELTVFGGFDQDDPDFLSSNNETPPFPARPRSRMSGSRNSSSSSLRRIASNNSIGRQLSDNMRQFSFEILAEDGTQEELGSNLAIYFSPSSSNIQTLTGSVEAEQCHTCGAIWSMEQFSIDCNECGGSALKKKCLKCDGSCGQNWRRDLVSSHVLGKASWFGNCQMAAATSSDQEDNEENICESPKTTNRLEKVIQRLQDI